MTSAATFATIRERLAAEQGRTDKQAAVSIALAYPSPYSVGMSSLGFQQIYRSIQATAGLACERVFLPDGGDEPGTLTVEESLSYESLRPLSEFPVVAFSVAYEMELAGLVRMLAAAKIPLLRSARDERQPFILVGGPLTFSNPLPIAPFADAVIMGEGEGVAQLALDIILGSERKEALRRLAEHPHIFVPEHHGNSLPPVAKCDDELLPAHSAIRTPHTELSNMFLIEVARGCSRGCQYCVMRRTTNGGMRIVPKERLLELIPVDAAKVGLVGAAVSDHPKITEIVSELADRGATVGLSSLRPDRLKEPFVAALKRAGYRTLTTALDGASERMRDMIERRGREPHYEQAAAFARAVGMDRMKLYLMLGLPGETDADVAECVDFVGKLSTVIPIALGIAPFCAKRNTPLDGEPFAGVDVVRGRLDLLRKGLRGRADIRSASAKWAWVEYVLAQGGIPEGHAFVEATLKGGAFSDYRAAFAELGYSVKGSQGSRASSYRTLFSQAEATKIKTRRLPTLAP